MNCLAFHQHPLSSIVCGLLLALAMPRHTFAQPPPAALAAFNSYAAAVESSLHRRHLDPHTFITGTAGSTPTIERVAPSPPLTAALLHHWRGTAFAPGATAADFERLLRDFNAYPQRFAPEVLDTRVLGQHGDHMQAWMRVRQKHVLTVVLDTTYDITFGQLDPQDRFSTSRSTQIYEIDAPGTAHERNLTPRKEHGFLWRLNTYWTYAERDGGLFVQIETVSLSRSIPTGLGWAIAPYVDSVPRDSLQFTLRSAIQAISHTKGSSR